MKVFKRIIKAISVAHIAIWLGLLILAIAEYALYTGAGEEPLGIAMETGIRGLFVVVMGVGVTSAGMLLLSVFRFCAVEKNVRDRLKTVTLVACVTDNILLYLSVYFLFWVNRDYVLVFPLAWLICTIICVFLLAIDS